MAIKKSKITSEKKEDKNEDGSLFVPAGVLTGMGFGFLFENIPAGLFIGLGVGMGIWAVIALLRK